MSTTRMEALNSRENVFFCVQKSIYGQKKNYQIFFFFIGGRIIQFFQELFTLGIVLFYLRLNLREL